MSHLLRSHAPVTEANWALLDEEAAGPLRVALGARKLVDFAGPYGWSYSATNLGRTATVDSPLSGIAARRRRTLPLTELRADFDVARGELRDHERGAEDVELDNLGNAALRIAEAENAAIFHGWESADIIGVCQRSPHAPIARAGDFSAYARYAAEAVGMLRDAGVGGPYALGLGPADYTGVVETSEHGGYPLFDHLRKILGGPLVWVPGLGGGVVLSTRGGDFLFESGADLAIGYERHDADSVFLYIEESFSFRVATPEAAVEICAS
jgi:uncharacterized linocin/CFP29 family protein